MPTDPIQDVTQDPQSLIQASTVQSQPAQPQSQQDNVYTGRSKFGGVASIAVEPLAVPEAPAQEKPVKAEVAIPQVENNGKPPALEKLKTPETPQKQEKTQQPQGAVTPLAPKTDAKMVTNVVDKTTNSVQVRPLKTTDKLTTIADQEEEKFIKKVLEEHAHSKP